MSGPARRRLSRDVKPWRTLEALKGESDVIELDRPIVGGSDSLVSSRLGSASTATTAVWIGLALVSSGFGSIVYAWVKVAGLINVAQQLPYVVSGGLVGLALVIVGLTVVDVAVRRQDSYERRQRMAQMNEILAELREDIEAGEHDECGSRRP